MMAVAGDDEGERAHAHRMTVGLPAPRPRLLVEAAEQGEARFALRREARDEIAQRLIVERRGGDVLVFLEARQGRLVSATEAQRAIAEHALAIGHVPEHLLDAPLAGRVAQ